MTPPEPLPKLRKPPISEVVCGIVFAPLDLDPVVLGPYCKSKSRTFPKHQIQPALEDAPPPGIQQFILATGVPRLRTWLLSANDSYVLQAQHDRFFLNWRRVDAERVAYPRFNDYDGGTGLLSQTLSEFQEFSEFCQGAVSKTPEPARIELAKVDRFVEGRDWDGVADLGRMIPSLRPLVDFASSNTPSISFGFTELRETGMMAVSFQAALASGPRVAKLETRCSLGTDPSQEGVRDAFQRANRELNEAFERLIPRTELDRRFR